MKTKIIISFALIIYAATNVSAQFNFNGQIMNRSEYRHGYQALADTNQKSAFFISQRSRLMGKYDAEKFRIGVSVQDIRTWGNTSHLAIDDKGLLSVHEAWGELLFNKNYSFKFGRQELSYDEDRIFGSLDWAMQARRHDVGVFKYKDSTSNLHVGFAYNQDKEQSKTTVYSVPNNYKTFQFLYYNKQINKLNFSFLFLNNGLQYSKTDTSGKTTNKTLFSQTVGPRFVYKKDKFTINTFAYYQMGKDGADKEVSAYDASAEITYSFTKQISLTAGLEMLSGTSQIDTANKQNNSFNPFYGTNHRFNGYMDYFYVGNHVNNVGLQDIFIKALYKKEKYFLSLNTHFFSSATDIRDKTDLTTYKSMSRNLGTEIDFTVSYNFTEGVSIQAGYSMMFATKSMEAIKGGNKDQTQNWAYLMFVIRPSTTKWPRVGLKM